MGLPMIQTRTFWPLLFGVLWPIRSRYGVSIVNIYYYYYFIIITFFKNILIINKMNFKISDQSLINKLIENHMRVLFKKALLTGTITDYTYC